MSILGVYYLPDEHVPDHIWMATLYHFISKPVWMELGGGAQAYWAFGHRTRCNYIVSGALKFEYNPLNKLSSTNIQDVNKARELYTRNSCFPDRVFCCCNSQYLFPAYSFPENIPDPCIYNEIQNAFISAFICIPLFMIVNKMRLIRRTKVTLFPGT